jgi:hypothetical protein
MKKGNVKKGRKLEDPVLNLMKQELKRRLGKPYVEDPTGERWVYIWKGSHIYQLDYTRRPQTANVYGQPLPDFILSVDRRERLAIECKNYSLTSEWSKGTARRDIAEKLSWLPASCKRVVIATHLNANGRGETMEIRSMLEEEGIEIHLLGQLVGFSPLTGQKLDSMLAPIVTRLLGLVRSRRRKARKRQLSSRT